MSLDSLEVLSKFVVQCFNISPLMFFLLAGCSWRVGGIIAEWFLGGWRK